MTIGNRIRILRAELRMTQEEFAKTLNTATSTVCNWENDKMTPKISNLKRIAFLAGISVEELLGKEGKEKQNVMFVKINDNRFGIMFINLNEIKMITPMNMVDDTFQWGISVDDRVYFVNELPKSLKGMMEE
jgi:transcriptional regulator with XRE-family HTH domain